MSNVTMPVPVALVEALREALGQIPAEPVEREGLYPTLYWAARALVDAVERPTAGEDEPIKCPSCGVARGWNDEGHLTRGIWTLNCADCGSFEVEIKDAPADPVNPDPICTRCGYGHMPEDSCRTFGPADPVSEARCRCGHSEDLHWQGVGKCFAGPSNGFRQGCTCDLFRTPGPPPMTPREELADAERFKAAREALAFAAYMFALNGVRYGQETTQEIIDWLNAFAEQHYPRLSDPSAPAATPPTTADLPTTPGSVIEVQYMGMKRLMMRTEKNEWVDAMGQRLVRDINLVRVLFDAGRDHA